MNTGVGIYSTVNDKHISYIKAHAVEPANLEQ
jgi:hypothetical protein